MPRAAGSRTGRKHLKRKKQLLAAEEKASQQPRLTALEDAVAAARVALAVAAGDKGAVSAWLDDVLKQVERHVQFLGSHAGLRLLWAVISALLPRSALGSLIVIDSSFLGRPCSH